MLQSLGACAGMVVPRAVVRDLHTGHDATRLMSLLMLVVSISPILAPLTGSAIIAGFGWRGVFWALTLAASIAFVLALTQLPETLAAHHRAASSWRGAFSGYLRLMADRSFLGLTLVGAFGAAAFFVYLANASFVIIGHYGLSPTVFSLCFALNAASFFGFSQLTARLSARYGLAAVIRSASMGFALAMLGAALLFALGSDSLPLMMAFLFIGYGFLGLVLPSSAVLSLEEHGNIAGTASALMGAFAVRGWRGDHGGVGDIYRRPSQTNGLCDRGLRGHNFATRTGNTQATARLKGHIARAGAAGVVGGRQAITKAR